MSNLDKGRNVEIDFSFSGAGGTKIDGIKAALNKVEELEALNDKIPQTNLSGRTVVLTGATPYKVYAFSITANFTTGIYRIEFIEEAPNVESFSFS